VSASRIVGWLLKRMVLRPRVKKLTWSQLCAGAAASHERFEQLIAGETEESAAVRVGGEMSIKEMLAHLAAENRGVASQLAALRQGRPGEGILLDAFEPQSLEQARAEFTDSWRALTQAAAHPIPEGTTADHAFFGPLTAREWLALVTYNHELHARKIDQIRQSEPYRKAQGARW
jgi:hypothetical protein